MRQVARSQINSVTVNWRDEVKPPLRDQPGLDQEGHLPLEVRRNAYGRENGRGREAGKVIRPQYPSLVPGVEKWTEGWGEVSWMTGSRRQVWEVIGESSSQSPRITGHQRSPVAPGVPSLLCDWLGVASGGGFTFMQSTASGAVTLLMEAFEVHFHGVQNNQDELCDIRTAAQNCDAWGAYWVRTEFRSQNDDWFTDAVRGGGPQVWE